MDCSDYCGKGNKYQLPTTVLIICKTLDIVRFTQDRERRLEMANVGILIEHFNCCFIWIGYFSRHGSHKL